MTGLAVPADLISISESETVLYPSRVSGWALVLCLISLFKKYGFAIKPFSLLRDHFRDISFVPLNHKNSPDKSGSNSL